ncbi:MAG: class I SAM-dependent methyltransferase [Parvibaculum sp.]
MQKTVEPQYKLLMDVKEKHGIASFGLMANESWACDPKRTLFTLARYKFVGKMLAGKASVLEVGCADAFGTRIVQQHVGSVVATDIDPIFIEDAENRMDPSWPLELRVHDMIAGPIEGPFNAAYSLDVLEHIRAEDERAFLGNVASSLTPTGVAIVGMPSLESQAYASPQSKEGHVNCKSGEDFKMLMEEFFENCFLFSMNDEVIHTGFSKMAHYVLVLGCMPKR